MGSGCVGDPLPKAWVPAPNLGQGGTPPWSSPTCKKKAWNHSDVKLRRETSIKRGKKKRNSSTVSAAKFRDLM